MIFKCFHACLNANDSVVCHQIKHKTHRPASTACPEHTSADRREAQPRQTASWHTHTHTRSLCDCVVLPERRSHSHTHTRLHTHTERRCESWAAGGGTVGMDSGNGEREGGRERERERELCCYVYIACTTCLHIPVYIIKSTVYCIAHFILLHILLFNFYLYLYIYSLVLCYVFCTVHWADRTWFTLHYCLYSV